jgi:hypothetical protein
VAALMLPSHSLWMAKELYDRGHYDQSLRHAEEAIEGRGRLSRFATIEAFRYGCLSSSRLGQDAKFLDFISRLKEIQKSNFERANVEFLLGFNNRLRGYLNNAETHYEEAYRLNLRNFQVLRELSYVKVVRGDFVKAEEFARKAFDIAPDNAFVIDILIGALVGRQKGESSLQRSIEIDQLLFALEGIETPHQSFSLVRRFDIALVNGSISLAAAYIEEARKKTPLLPSVLQRLAVLDLKNRNIPSVRQHIDSIQRQVDNRKNFERKSSIRLLLELKFEYYIAQSMLEEAFKQIDNEFFSDEEKERFRKDIDYRRN